jgi:hypothetical protein
MWCPPCASTFLGNLAPFPPAAQPTTGSAPPAPPSPPSSLLYPLRLSTSARRHTTPNPDAMFYSRPDTGTIHPLLPLPRADRAQAPHPPFPWIECRRPPFPWIDQIERRHPCSLPPRAAPPASPPPVRRISTRERRPLSQVRASANPTHRPSPPPSGLQGAAASHLTCCRLACGQIKAAHERPSRRSLLPHRPMVRICRQATWGLHLHEQMWRGPESRCQRRKASTRADASGAHKSLPKAEGVRQLDSVARRCSPVSPAPPPPLSPSSRSRETTTAGGCVRDAPSCWRTHSC